MLPICIFTDCEHIASVDKNGRDHTQNPKLWCPSHYGLFHHQCEEPGCETRVVYDDEPKCFTHSPDEGSSVQGYSAYAKTQEVSNG